MAVWLGACIFCCQFLKKLIIKTETAPRGALSKNFLKISQNLQENTCARVSFLTKLQAEICNFINKETMVQVFSCEFCEKIFIEHLQAAASVQRIVATLVLV